MLRHLSASASAAGVVCVAPLVPPSAVAAVDASAAFASHT